MDLNVVLCTTVPPLILIGLGGYSSKKLGLKPEDERVLSAYIYYFALPALFIIDLSNISLNGEAARFILAGVTATLILLAIYFAAYLVVRFSRGCFAY
ncbi:MAG: AEC family transporter [Thermoproteota archaeon]